MKKPIGFFNGFTVQIHAGTTDDRAEKAEREAERLRGEVDKAYARAPFDAAKLIAEVERLRGIIAKAEQIPCPLEGDSAAYVKIRAILREADAPPAVPRRMRANPESGAAKHMEEHNEMQACAIPPPCEPVDVPLAANNNIMLRSERSERR